uniref:VWFA domain-containing protein n=1 Tax=Candidatus Kentrum sp. FM TaxID=2126340 RepID=A0A450RZE7_9GAMM|nr:MAG: hypothetical protein BECKFM1743A_GA0114220_100198 [Candidatus Kentron sp. FM]VFJ45002.1 MAG: hypothetical protein BECKFM1743C_GA0114222_100198 [Candidatus Kentron sp. FM]VFK06629.1 MAG: hypothetical protein BECKFM1743B_GA0114221_100218 [Candidatus Kentron sp. FM]
MKSILNRTQHCRVFGRLDRRGMKWTTALLLWVAISITQAQAGNRLESPSSFQPADIESWRVDHKGTCPDLDILNIKKDGDALTQEDFDRIRSSQLQILRPRIYLSRDPQLLESVDDGELKFGERVVVYRTVYKGDERHFVKVTDKGICGWILAKTAGGVGEPLPLTEIPGYEEAMGTDRERSRLTAKAVIMSTRDGERMLKVPVFSRPNDGERWKVREVGYFAIVELYDFRLPSDDKPPRCDNISEENCFLLVGGTSRSEKGVALPEYLGWVRSRDLALWPSALSLYYHKDSREARIYTNEKSAKRRSDAPGDILAYQESWHGEPKEQNIPRFPVVDGESRGGGDYVYRIVFAGEACEEAGGRCRSGKQALQDIGALGRQVYRSEGIDILFVIDGTRSMGRYYPPIIDAIENIAQEGFRQNLRMRFAVVVYGDYRGGSGTPDNVELKTVADFSKVGETNPLERLLRIRDKPIGDAHGDFPEAPFGAIVAGLQRVEQKWAPDSLLRLVVWIGDHGNRELGSHTTPTGGQLEEYVSTGDVSNTLKRNNAAFTAVQVTGDRQSDFANSDFVHDAQAIIDSMGTDQHLPLRQAKMEGEFNANEFRRVVEAKLQEIIDTSTMLREGISTAGPGSALDLRLPAARLANYYLQNDLKLSAETIHRVAGEVQQITTGVVYYDADDPDFAFWLALRSQEFNELEQSVGNLCQALESTDFYDQIKDAMASVLEAATFERPKDDENIAEFLKKRFSIPKPRFSELLDRSLAEFVTWWFAEGNTEEKRDFATQVCRKDKMLDYVRRGERVALEDIALKAGRWRLKRGAKKKEFAWDWSISSGIRYYFVPLEYLL